MLALSAERFAHLDGCAGLYVTRKFHRARRKQRHHRGTKHEGPYFVATLEGNARRRLQLSPPIGRSRAVRPGNCDAPHDHRAHQHQGACAEIRIKV